MANPSSHPSRELPESETHSQAAVATAELLAKILDATVRIPGTSLSLGLDPLIGLIPGVGDVLAGLVGAIILGLAAHLQVPRMVIARMSVNLLMNGAIGTIPIFGDLFSVWFKSNSRNAELLRQAATQPARATHGDWIYVVGIVGGTLALLLGLSVLVLWLAISLWRSFAGIS
ncbi:MAG: DUF4112 domain-containing protein [Nitrospira sp.]